MTDKITVAQAGALGGKKRWSKISKKKRSATMRKVALARYAKTK